MTKRIVIFVAAALALASAFAACDGAQSRPPCLVGHGGFALKYLPKDGQTLTGACLNKTAEVAGFQPYYNEEGTRQDRVVIKTATLTALEENANVGVDPDSRIYSTGTLTDTVPDGEDFCHVPTMSRAEQHIAADPGDIDAGIAPTPSLDISYAFSNVKFYVTPEAPGTQMSAELEFTQDGCTGKYTVIGVNPAVSCAVLDKDDEVVLNDDGTIKLDPSKCEAPNYYYRQLNSAFPVKCEWRSALCLLQGDSIPQLQTVESAPDAG
ncbi:MAG: hypothetical protein ACYC8T_16720 [Myxococcaceae bacterium]